jgi:putative SOS response-associated peptidase YedK
MCGRYELHSNPSAIALAFGLAHPPDVQARYNIAPMTDVPIVRVSTDGEHREVVRMRWGMVPRWAKDPSVGARMINARGETLADRPSFQMPYRRHRCLLPADGFYEWQPVARSAGAEDKRKQPMHIGMADGSLFGLAGLYERWRGEDGTVLDTCAIVTTTANALLAPIHDRMPVIIGPDDYARWLDPANADVADLIAPYPSSSMACYPVSLRVNAVRHDDAALLERVEPQAREASEAEVAPTVPEQESLF